jgi:hypothetical protein
LGALVEIDEAKCDELARFIASKTIPLDQEESSLPGLARDSVGNFFLALVAICHQTSPRGLPPLEGEVRGVTRRGWDYLFGRLEEAVLRDPTLAKPQRWSTLSTEDVRLIFRDANYGDRLTSPELRAELLRDLGNKMISQNIEHADQIYRLCNGRIGTGSPNLLTELGKFRAYDDPVSKKSVFFLAVMRNFGLWRYSDDMLLGPPVDYHEVRGHLRIGTVRITDPEFRLKVLNGVEVNPSEDVALRKSVYRAIMLISEKCGLRNPSQLHYLFWNVFRTICTRESPQCFKLSVDCRLPERYMHLARVGNLKQCPFSSICVSAGAANPICEHVFETDYY